MIALGPAGCGESAGTPAAQEEIQAQVVLPGFPYEENPAIKIDTQMLDDLAGRFLTGGGRVDQVPEFLFGYVPVWAFDRLAAMTYDTLEELEGLLYLSGFFGGVWLKGVLDPGPPGADADLPFLPSGLEYSGVEGAFSLSAESGPETNMFTFLAFFTGIMNELVRSGNPGSLNRFLIENMDFYIFLYGYNKGYLQSILDFPPEGTEPPPGYLTCTHFLDCTTPVQGISVLEDLIQRVEYLRDPPDSRWERMKNKVDSNGPAAEERGYDVWRDHLSVEDMLPEDYRVLLDLSGGFLLYCQVLVLSAMDAWVLEDATRATQSAAVSAGMTGWVGGYGIGLISDSSYDELPRIEILTGR